MFSFSFFLIYKYCKQGSMECCPVLSKASLTEIITSFLHNSGLFSKWQGFSKNALISRSVCKILLSVIYQNSRPLVGFIFRSSLSQVFQKILVLKIAESVFFSGVRPAVSLTLLCHNSLSKTFCVTTKKCENKNLT